MSTTIQKNTNGFILKTPSLGKPYYGRIKSNIYTVYCLQDNEKIKIYNDSFEKESDSRYIFIQNDDENPLTEAYTAITNEEDFYCIMFKIIYGSSYKSKQSTIPKIYTGKIYCTNESEDVINLTSNYLYCTEE